MPLASTRATLPKDGARWPRIIARLSARPITVGSAAHESRLRRSIRSSPGTSSTIERSVVGTVTVDQVDLKDPKAQCLQSCVRAVRGLSNRSSLMPWKKGSAWSPSWSVVGGRPVVLGVLHG
ncbi:hypothetical protein AQI96_40575 [Streptomyces canus]|nr:hypothetical protein AQI96_40575 [Streptomyces canus]